MITEKLIDMFKALVVSVAGLLPDGVVPAWFTGFTTDLGTWLGYGSTVGAWLPFNLMLTVAAALMVCTVAGFAIKLTRVVLSFVTLGGGSAG